MKKNNLEIIEVIIKSDEVKLFEKWKSPFCFSTYEGAKAILQDYVKKTGKTSVIYVTEYGSKDSNENKEFSKEFSVRTEKMICDINSDSVLAIARPVIIQKKFDLTFSIKQ